MADSFPQSHTTGTTRAGVTTSSRPSIYLEEWRSLPGLVKIAEMILSLITFICAASANCSTFGNPGWASFVSFTGFFIAVAFFVALLLHLRQKAPSSVPLLLIELIICGIWTFFFFIAGIALAVTASNYWYCRGSTGAGSFFAFLAMIAFGIDTALLFFAYRQSRSGLPTATPNTTTYNP